MGGGWPDGPEILIYGQGEEVNSKDYSPRDTGSERLLLLPVNTKSNERTEPLIDYFNGPTIDIDSFVRRVTS